MQSRVRYAGEDFSSRVFGIPVVVDEYLPGPRPITPGEWAEKYVRYHMQGVLAQCSQRYPSEIPWREPQLTDTVNTVYLLPEPRPIIPSLDPPSVLPSYPDKDDVAAMRARWEVDMHMRVGAMVVSPPTLRDLMIISGVW